MPLPQPDRVKCRSCGTVHQIVKREARLRNEGTLRCRKCGRDLVIWKGRFIYTFEADPPDSASEMSDFDTVMNLPAQQPKSPE